MKALPSPHWPFCSLGRGSLPPCLKVLSFQVRELQTRLQSVQATGPSSPGRLTSANRPVNPSTGELSTSSSSNDIPIAKVRSGDAARVRAAPAFVGQGRCANTQLAQGAPRGFPGSCVGLPCWSRRKRQPINSFKSLLAAAWMPALINQRARACPS